jgi:CheY-like chemotaxis protein
MIRHLLSVDDDDVTRMIIRKMLELVGQEVRLDTVANGQEALDWLGCRQDGSFPDLILLDLNMPVMDGWVFLDRFSAMQPDLCPHTAAAILTSSSNPRDLSAPRACPFVAGCFFKPLTLKTMAEILRLCPPPAVPS